MPTSSTFEAAVSLIKQMQGKHWISDAEVLGEVPVDSVSIANVRCLVSEDCGISLIIDDREIVSNIENELDKMQSGSLLLKIPTVLCGPVYRDFDSFLSVNGHIQRSPDMFYTDAECIDSRAPDGSNLSDYYDALHLVDLLNHLSDIPSSLKGNGGLIFFSGKAKLEIEVSYRYADLRPLNRLTDIRADLLSDSVNINEKRELFKSSVIDSILMNNIRPSEYFKTILKCFGSIIEGYEESYRIYIHKFSVKEIKKEIETNKLELAQKIHDVMSDLNKTLLLIPIAVVFMAARIDYKNPSGLSSIVCIVAVGIFIGLVLLNLYNHNKTLSFVKNEINRQKKYISTHYSDIEADILPSYEYLEQRIKYQTVIRRCVGSCLWFIFFMMIALYGYLHFGRSLPAKHRSENSTTASQCSTVRLGHEAVLNQAKKL